MLTQEKMKNVDKSRMYEIYDNWPKLAENGFNNNFKEIVKRDISHIVFALQRYQKFSYATSAQYRQS